MASLVDGTGSRVVEIGAGTGRTAFYVRHFGITDYTIIDLPITNVVQANFLSRVLDYKTVALFGEEEDRSQIRILPSTAFFRSDDKYDLVVNVDSLTEMSVETARSYCLAIKNRTQKFLSINHEANDFTVRNICSETGFPKGSRHPYWLRRGYVQELFSFSGKVLDPRPAAAS
jgi:putative sugar O-methyltransferase